MLPYSPSSDGYDVFLNFRGIDTRNGFTNNLYHSLLGKGVKAFMDDTDIPKGAPITFSLPMAIRKSRMAIVVFSENYASSEACLDELAQIYELCEEGKIKVFPVFYNVEPAVVKHQKASYGTAFLKHAQGRLRYEAHKLQKWKTALLGVGDMHGWPFKNEGREKERDLITTITDQICGELKNWNLNGKAKESSIPQHSKIPTSTATPTTTALTTGPTSTSTSTSTSIPSGLHQPKHAIAPITSQKTSIPFAPPTPPPFPSWPQQYYPGTQIKTNTTFNPSSSTLITHTTISNPSNNFHFKSTRSFGGGFHPMGVTETAMSDNDQNERAGATGFGSGYASSGQFYPNQYNYY